MTNSHIQDELDRIFADIPVQDAKYKQSIYKFIEARERAAEERLLDELEAKIKPYGLGETDDEVAWMPVHKALNIIATKRQALKEGGKS